LRIFVCEFVTGGGFVGKPLPPGLSREGGMMLQALVKDLADLSGVTVAITRDQRLPDPGLAAAVRTIAPSEDPWTIWHREIAAADALWPIAPETERILERLSTLAVEAGRKLLGSGPDAVRLTASKLTTAIHLGTRGIAVPPTVQLDAALIERLPPSDTGWIVKPDDGAGTEDTVLWRSDRGLYDWAAERADAARFVAQPYLPGPAASLSLLCCDGRATLLSCNSQDVRLDGDRFRYHGGVVGGREAERPRLAPLAGAIAAAIPGLWGHVGVDLIETKRGPVVLEINPRLTTSYVGLRTALGRNPAALVMNLLIDAIPPSISSPVRPQRVSLDPSLSLPSSLEGEGQGGGSRRASARP
jgi:tyramine---L-glutamate ligase